MLKQGYIASYSLKRGDQVVAKAIGLLSGRVVVGEQRLNDTGKNSPLRLLDPFGVYVEICCSSFINRDTRLGNTQALSLLAQAFPSPVSATLLLPLPHGTTSTSLAQPTTFHSDLYNTTKQQPPYPSPHITIPTNMPTAPPANSAEPLIPTDDSPSPKTNLKILLRRAKDIAAPPPPAPPPPTAPRTNRRHPPDEPRPLVDPSTAREAPSRHHIRRTHHVAPRRTLAPTSQKPAAPTPPPPQPHVDPTSATPTNQAELQAAKERDDWDVEWIMMQKRMAQQVAEKQRRAQERVEQAEICNTSTPKFHSRCCRKHRARKHRTLPTMIASAGVAPRLPNSHASASQATHRERPAELTPLGHSTRLLIPLLPDQPPPTPPAPAPLLPSTLLPREYLSPNPRDPYNDEEPYNDDDALRFYYPTNEVIIIPRADISPVPPAAKVKYGFISFDKVVPPSFENWWEGMEEAKVFVCGRFGGEDGFVWLTGYMISSDEVEKGADYAVRLPSAGAEGEMKGRWMLLPSEVMEAREVEMRRLMNLTRSEQLEEDRAASEIWERYLETRVPEVERVESPTNPTYDTRNPSFRTPWFEVSLVPSRFLHPLPSASLSGMGGFDFIDGCISRDLEEGEQEREVKVIATGGNGSGGGRRGHARFFSGFRIRSYGSDPPSEEQREGEEEGGRKWAVPVPCVGKSPEGLRLKTGYVAARPEWVDLRREYLVKLDHNTAYVRKYDAPGMDWDEVKKLHKYRRTKVQGLEPLYSDTTSDKRWMYISPSEVLREREEQMRLARQVLTPSEQRAEDIANSEALDEWLEYSRVTDKERREILIRRVEVWMERVDLRGLSAQPSSIAPLKTTPFESPPFARHSRPSIPKSLDSNLPPSPPAPSHLLPQRHYPLLGDPPKFNRDFIDPSAGEVIQVPAALVQRLLPGTFHQGIDLNKNGENVSSVKILISSGSVSTSTPSQGSLYSLSGFLVRSHTVETPVGVPWVVPLPCVTPHPLAGGWNGLRVGYPYVSERPEWVDLREEVVVRIADAKGWIQKFDVPENASEGLGDEVVRLLKFREREVLGLRNLLLDIGRRWGGQQDWEKPQHGGIESEVEQKSPPPDRDPPHADAHGLTSRLDIPLTHRPPPPKPPPAAHPTVIPLPLPTAPSALAPPSAPFLPDGEHNPLFIAYYHHEIIALPSHLFPSAKTSSAMQLFLVTSMGTGFAGFLPEDTFEGPYWKLGGWFIQPLDGTQLEAYQIPLPSMLGPVEGGQRPVVRTNFAAEGRMVVDLRKEYSVFLRPGIEDCYIQKFDPVAKVERASIEAMRKYHRVFVLKKKPIKSASSSEKRWNAYPQSYLRLKMEAPTVVLTPSEPEEDMLYFEAGRMMDIRFEWGSMDEKTRRARMERRVERWMEGVEAGGNAGIGEVGEEGLSSREREFLIFRLGMRYGDDSKGEVHAGLWWEE
ncbi:hypothetical protein BJ508DRAFT_346255 [Ascobolus immersus RN42]|uniref:Uncharacterized protein n=1 Tax=Ascobolus immersus RN42 TaxID=1160509 RepID=A0A3N4H7V3_ASCIM|nr:hypothetical protein BJ508DRAFT_346255 [Ascobolus immersus RN42]